MATSPRNVHLPRLIPAPNGRWVLVEPFRWSGRIQIPVGFESDLDTVPRIPILHAWLKGRTRVGALVHDWMLCRGYSRACADRVFDQVMRWEGVKTRYRVPIYASVRIYGWIKEKIALLL